MYSDQYKKLGDMFRFKGIIIRPNMKTQSWYIQSAHTTGSHIVCNCIDIKVHV